MSSTDWTIVTAVAASVAGLAAVGSLIFFIMQYISENAPNLEINAEFHPDGKDYEVIRIKNSGNRAARFIEFSDSIGIMKYGTLFKGDVFDIELFQRNKYEEIHYRRFRWSPKIYLKSYADLEKINRNTFENYSPEINSISGRVKLKKILKAVKKDSWVNEIQIKIVSYDENRSFVEFEYKNKDGFKKSVQEFFESNISIITFYLSEILKEYDFICDNSFESKNTLTSLLIVKKKQISRALLKRLNLFKIFIPTRFENKYNYIGKTIDNFKAFDSLENLNKGYRFMIDSNGSVKIIAPFDNFLKKIEDSTVTQEILIKEGLIPKNINKYDHFFNSNKNENSNKIIEVNGYIDYIGKYLIISDSQINFNCSVTTDFKAIRTTIVNLNNKVIYSSHVESINNKKLSETQFDEFMRQFNFAYSKRKRFKFNKPSKIVFKYKIESNFIDKYVMK